MVKKTSFIIYYGWIFNSIFFSFSSRIYPPYWLRWLARNLWIFLSAAFSHQQWPLEIDDRQREIQEGELHLRGRQGQTTLRFIPSRMTALETFSSIDSTTTSAIQTTRQSSLKSPTLHIRITTEEVGSYVNECNTCKRTSSLRRRMISSPLLDINLWTTFRWT